MDWMACRRSTSAGTASVPNRATIAWSYWRQPSNECRHRDDPFLLLRRADGSVLGRPGVARGDSTEERKGRRFRARQVAGYSRRGRVIGQRAAGQGRPAEKDKQCDSCTHPKSQNLG